MFIETDSKYLHQRNLIIFRTFRNGVTIICTVTSALFWVSKILGKQEQDLNGNGKREREQKAEMGSRTTSGKSKVNVITFLYRLCFML